MCSSDLARAGGMADPWLDAFLQTLSPEDYAEAEAAARALSAGF